MTRAPHIGTFAIFMLVAAAFGLTTSWLLQHNYNSEQALYNWATVRAIFDAETLRLESLGFDRPHGTILALAPFYLIPGLQSISPFVLSVISGAILFALWYRHLAQSEYPVILRLIMMMLIIVNPAVIWSATSGGSEAIVLLMFYLLYRSCLRMVYEKDIRSFIALGLIMAVFVYCDVIAIYLLLALVPLLAFVVPIPMLRESPLSVYIIIGMPLAVVVASWIYFNWIFLGEPLAFLDTYKSAFAGSMSHAETLPWLQNYGGQFVVPMVLGLAYVIAGYPSLMFLLWRSVLDGRRLHIALALMFYPIISIGLGSWTFFLASPFQITTLFAAGVMAEITKTKCCQKSTVLPLLLLLGIGAGTNWYMTLTSEYSYIKPWSMALSTTQKNQFSGDFNLGRWLAENRAQTLLDLRSAYKVIVARGDATDLLLPYSQEYRLLMRSERPNVAQVAIPDPETPQGRRDELNLRFPKMYENGLPGYKLVYDEDGWRVYQRQ